MADIASTYTWGTSVAPSNVAGTAVAANTAVVAVDNTLNPLTSTNLASTGIKPGSVDMAAAIEQSMIQLMDYLADN